MGSILIFSDRDRCAFELLSKARELGPRMGLEVAAAALGKAQAEEYRKRGAAKVYTCSHELLQAFEALVYAQALSPDIGGGPGLGHSDRFDPPRQGIGRAAGPEAPMRMHHRCPIP